MNLLFETRTAVFSPDRAYRYRLKQTWDPVFPHLCFLMLNPSTADEMKNEPTVERCERRARTTAGCGGLEVVNIFAYRATDPSDMKAQADPIGPENDRHIIEAASSAAMVICAWGNHGDHMDRGRAVAMLLRGQGIPLYSLRIWKGGHLVTHFISAMACSRRFGKEE